MGAPSVLFVCLGNICRSPLAEGAMRAATEDAGLDVRIDSAGTGGWHVGNPPDERAITEAKRHGVDISGLRARQVGPKDFKRFTHIFALDAQNLADLRRMAPADATSELGLLLNAVPGREGEAVADPYYGDTVSFSKTWRDVSEAAEALVARLSQ
ncbi:MAG: low molecular weight protein-tyrosine-phosphatase [Alteraurantiacibacter sp.]